MNVLMVTPHLPPHQAANALLPHLLGQDLRGHGHGVRFLTFGGGPDSAEIAHVRRRGARLRATRVPQALEAAETWWKAEALLKDVDVVHVHSNTWMNQVAARLCTARLKPYVVTHYGTEIWHHDGKDESFRRLNREARHVAFYSQALLARALELEVPLPAASVVYPPVADAFQVQDDAERAAVRSRLGLAVAAPLLLNVKRLHPLADQKTLLDAFARVRRDRPDALLLVAGTGECRQPLEAQARALDLGASARLLGLVPNEQVAALQAAADLFVLSSTLEATPTVALEALASGTPVVSTDNPGGVELRELFGDDVAVVPKQDPVALADAVLAFLAQPRRARRASQERIASEFRLPGVALRYLQIYREALAA